MRLFIKIILIILLVALLCVSVWFFCLRVFLADAYFRKAMQYRNGNSWAETLMRYNKVLAYQPYQPFYQKNFAIDLKNGLDFYKNQEAKVQIIDLAIERIEKISKKDVDFKVKRSLAQIYAVKANLTQKKEDFLLSEKLFIDLTQISPQMASIYKDWCQLKIEQQDWQTALEICRKAFYLYPEIKPETPKVRQDMLKAEMSEIYEKFGQIYFNLENWDKSEQMYTQALKLNPLRRPNIWKKIADIYYKQGDLDTAIKKNLHGLALSPKDAAWPLAIGLLYEQKGDTAEAKEYFQKALQLDPQNITASHFFLYPSSVPGAEE
ncbi:hypothetical protein B6D52_00765 [Candidatus Parcubacteria bacterium 4484_255]|nr:MAG: hypothetical protein B6D52_00765 [Candidatus Parcubacteria bacterium 4484_255]